MYIYAIRIQVKLPYKRESVKMWVKKTRESIRMSLSKRSSVVCHFARDTPTLGKKKPSSYTENPVALTGRSIGAFTKLG